MFEALASIFSNKCQHEGERVHTYCSQCGEYVRGYEIYCKDCGAQLTMSVRGKGDLFGFLTGASRVMQMPANTTFWSEEESKSLCASANKRYYCTKCGNKHWEIKEW